MEELVELVWSIALGSLGDVADPLREHYVVLRSGQVGGGAPRLELLVEGILYARVVLLGVHPRGFNFTEEFEDAVPRHYVHESRETGERLSGFGLLDTKCEAAAAEDEVGKRDHGDVLLRPTDCGDQLLGGGRIVEPGPPVGRIAFGLANDYVRDETDEGFGLDTLVLHPGEQLVVQ